MDESSAVLKEPIPWDMFMLMSDEEQEKYLQYIVNRFHVACGTIAQDLFGVSSQTLSRLIRRKRMDIPKSVGGRIPETVAQKWKEWTATKAAGQAPAGAPDADIAETVNSVIKNMQKTFGHIRVTITIEAAE